ncbi:MAG: CpsB/CapC family capsule biosynthesis tyrosine phosphatase [Bacteroidia bacterium]
MSFFSKFFSATPSIHIPFSAIGTDMHSHLIPTIDDGSKSMEDTIAMLHEFAAMGYTTIITTPHIMGDAYRNTPEIILGGLAQVRAEALKHPAIAHLRLEAAAEYYFDSDFEHKLNNEKLLTLGDNYVLFELSYINEPEGVNKLVYDMQMKGYKPILAHPERYPYWHRNLDKYEELSERGVYLQVNANSLVGHYGPPMKAVAEKLIEKNIIRFIGSDCHKYEHLGVTQRISKTKHLDMLVNSGLLLNTSL